MTKEYEESFLKVMELEGGFVLHQNKTEHAQTYAGIYRAAHPSWEGWRYIDDKAEPPVQLVREFYYDNFYKRYEDLQPKKAYLLFEFAVNASHQRAIMIAQRICGVADDGIMGPKTKEAIAGIEDEEFALRYTIARIAFYNSLAKKTQYRPYLRGWINRALEVLL
jgi:lysozyme family protein